jgi:hypothetical protein
MKFSDIGRNDLRTNVDGPVRELMSLGSEVRAATGKLASKLDDLSKQADPDVSYDNIDRMMRAICDHHGCKETELHDDFIAAKGMTPDQYVRERIRENGKSMLENSGYREFDVFVVAIPANVRAGRDYDFRTVPYRVYKGMEGVDDQYDAIRWVNDNRDTVLADLEGKRMRVGNRTVPWVMKPAADNVFFKDRYAVKPGKISHAVDHPNPSANYAPPREALDESAYDDRVQAVASAIIASSERAPLKKDQLAHQIEVEAGYQRVPELRFKDQAGSKAWPDFTKDVMAALRGKVKFSRGTKPAGDAKERRAKLLATISQWIDEAVGNSFPDGDPMDTILPKLRRAGIPEEKWMALVDAAVRAHGGARDFDTYMGRMYDDHAADDPEMMLQSGMLYNPYTNRPFNFLDKIDSLLKGGSGGLVLNIIANIPSKAPKHAALVDANKGEILKALLELIKRGGSRHLVGVIMRNIEHMGLAWPEFDAIRKSMEASNLREHMLPGDVLMIENETEAVVGTVLSIDGDTIILEGGAYPLGEEELEEKLTSDDRYERGEQGNWRTMVSREPVMIPKLTGSTAKYVARVEHKRNPKLIHTGVGMTQNGAIDDAMGKAQDLSRASTNPDDYVSFNVDFNVEFSNEHIDPRTGNYFKFEQGADGKPRLVMASREWFAMYGRDMEDLGFRRAHLRQEAERTGTRFYAFSLGVNRVKSLGLIPNMRYVLVEEDPDADGNTVFRLIADTRYTGIPKRLGEPGLTLAATPKDKKDSTVSADLTEHWYTDGSDPAWELEVAQGELEKMLRKQKTQQPGDLYHDQDLGSKIAELQAYINRLESKLSDLSEAEYQGREVKLGKPMAGDVKKYKVYVRDPKTGNVKKVNFGDKGMEIKRDDPKRRKSFRARHGCGTPRASDRTKAAYWSCRMWSSKPVSKILKGK